MIDYRIYAFCGDGDLMEGVSRRSGLHRRPLGLSNLIWFYDNNHITIEGHTALAFSEDVATRFLAYHWNVLRVGDANDLELLDRRHSTVAQKETDASVADYRGQPHRVGRAHQARHARRRTASRWAWRKSG